mmetsp:Transcript_21378/g.34497  ORF Transcript_21378/g.34497 Transcript_21378/m.34497 type:complete len:364 (+) Transcript_21378:137-1228(+)
MIRGGKGIKLSRGWTLAMASWRLGGVGMSSIDSSRWPQRLGSTRRLMTDILHSGNSKAKISAQGSEHNHHRNNYHRVARVAVIGTPNAGKSVIVNRMVESKVSAESPKRHTTRKEVLGILTENDTQLILTDTPGIVANKEKTRYESGLVRSPWEALFGVDAALVVIDAAKRLYEAEYQMLQRLQKIKDDKEGKSPPLFLALNKVDLVHPKVKLLDMSENLNDMLKFDAVHFTCATSGEGVQGLVADLLAEAKAEEWPFKSEKITNLSLEERVVEIMREKLFHRFHDELPYQIDQQIEQVIEGEDGSVLIRHILIVKTTGQKRIIEGKTGLKILALEKTMSEELENIVGCPVTLKLHVSVKTQN